MAIKTVLTNGSAATDALVAQTLQLKEDIISKISHDYKDDEQTSVPSSYALSELTKALDETIEERFSEIVNSTKEVFSISLVNPYFKPITEDDKLGWSVVGYTNQENTVTYTETGEHTTTNRLAIPQGRYKTLGQYFLYFNIDRLVGKVNIYKNGYLIKSFEDIGFAGVTFQITFLLSDDIYIQCENVPLNETVILSNVVCVYTIDDIYYYSLNFVKERIESIGDEAGFITADELSLAISAALQSMNQSLQAHIQEKNPHGTTPGTIGAAYAEHTHSQYVTRDEISGLTSNIYIVPEVVLEGPTGYFPREVAHGFLPLTSFIRTKTLSHTGGSNFSPYAGYIQSNVQSNAPLADAIDPAIAITDRYTRLSYAVRMVVKYTLVAPRKISTITLVSPNNGTDRKVNDIRISDGNNVLDIDLSNTDLEVITWPYEDDVESLTFTISDTTVQTSTAVLFGFDIAFADVPSGDIVISKGIKFSNIVEGILKIYSLTTDLYISSSALAVDHPYYISLLYNEDVPAVELLGVHPSYGYDTEYATYPLRYLESLQDSYHGTIATTGLTNNLEGYNIYAPDMVEPNTHRVTVTHAFVNNSSIRDFVIYVDKDRPDDTEYPINYKVTFTLANNTTVVKQASTINYFVNTPSEKIGIDVIDDVIDNVISYLVEIESNVGTIVHISSIDVGFVNKYYNIQTHIWNDNQVRQIVGTITRLSTGAVEITSAPLGKVACIPINNFDRCEIGQSYIVPNPYNTVLIQEVNFADLYNSGTFMIKSITDTEIEVVTDSDIIGYITVSRTW